MRASLLAAGFAAAVLVAAPHPAAARAERMISHAYERVWPTAVRFLRVDEGLTLVDKDADAGYVVFELVDKGKTFRGALELVAITDPEGRRAVRLVVTIDGRPEYTESGMLDRLLQKLRNEHGDPAPAPPPAPPDTAKPDDKAKPKK
jgi:hypothetical protein